MIHTVMMKFQPGVWSEAILTEFCQRFAEIQAALPQEVLKADVWPNCVVRDQNADVLVQMTVRDKEALPVYLNHPLHTGLVEKYRADIVKIVSFDREEE